MSISITVDSDSLKRDVQSFGAKLAEYQRATGKMAEDVLRRQGWNLALAMGSAKTGELRKITPTASSIREGNLSRMRGGGGLRISDKARRVVYQSRGIVQGLDRRHYSTENRGKTFRRARAVNIQQLLAAKELSLRVRGRGFLAVTAMFPGLKGIRSGQTLRYFDRSRSFTGDAKLSVGSDSVLTLWENVGAEVLRGLSTQRARSAVAAAFRSATADMSNYLERKQAELLKKARLS